MEFKNFSKYELSIRQLGGVTPKVVINDKGQEYMLKFAKQKLDVSILDHISEYLACSLAKELGYAVQEVELGYYKGKECVSCKLFNSIPTTYGGLGTSTLEGEDKEYDLDYLLSIKMNKKFNISQENYIKWVWGVFCLDFFLGNFDRHPNNWGFTLGEGGYELSPLYDLGASLSSRLIQCNPNEMTNDEIKHNIEFNVKSAIKFKGRKVSYFKFTEILNKELIFKNSMVLIISRFKNVNLNPYLDTILHFNPNYLSYCEYINRMLDLKIELMRERGII